VIDNFAPQPYREVPLRLREKYRVTAGGCWEWTSSTITDENYAMTWWDGRMRMAHRAIYEILVGEIPADLTLDHLCCSPEWCSGGVECMHRRCVNPDHLTPASGRDNTLRGNGIAARHARRTECSKGHPFDAENTAVRSGGGRRCRTCQREATRASEARRATPRVRPYKPRPAQIKAAMERESAIERWLESVTDKESV
jgi:hypothetical protein